MLSPSKHGAGFFNAGARRRRRRESAPARRSSAKIALSAAMRMSHMQARSKPAPIAGPLTAAISGMFSAWKASGMRWMPSR